MCARVIEVGWVLHGVVARRVDSAAPPISVRCPHTRRTSPVPTRSGPNRVSICVGATDAGERVRDVLVERAGQLGREATKKCKAHKYEVHVSEVCRDVAGVGEPGCSGWAPGRGRGHARVDVGRDLVAAPPPDKDPEGSCQLLVANRYVINGRAYPSSAIIVANTPPSPALKPANVTSQPGARSGRKRTHETPSSPPRLSSSIR